MGKERFQSTWGLILALLGLAIGTGNIWRFPRVVALNGGGAFLIAFIIALFLWAIPIILIEFSCGKRYGQGVFVVFSEMLGKKWVWMGAFIAFCTMGIMFYYSVIVGWCLKYFSLALTGSLFKVDSQVLWTQFTVGSMEPLYFHCISFFCASLIVLLGVIKGIERLCIILMPLFFLVLIALALFAMSLPNAAAGLNFIFSTDWSKLLSATTWIEAISQSAWSTGAGWGIILSYAAYSHSKENSVLHSFTTGLGDSSAAMIASLAIIPTLFAVLPVGEAMSITASGNTGLTFISLPLIFKQLEYGQLFAVFFFLALSCAAFTSLVSMIELGSHFLRNFGVSRRKSVFFIFFFGILIGTPSALRIDILNNQDWVWGLGLLLSGFFFAVLIHRYGIEKYLNENFSGMPQFFKFGFGFMVKWVIPLEFIIVISWWLIQSIKDNPEQWWFPLHSYNVGTCFLQWGILIIALLVLTPQWIKHIKYEED